MRSTAKQRFGIWFAPHSSVRWRYVHFASWLQLFLAAATAVASFVLLVADPRVPEMRRVLVALAVSLFLFSLTEKRAVRSGTPSSMISGGSDAERTAVGSEVQTKISQLELHRTDYVATVSHELRTPLTSIRGFAQLLAREELPASKSKSYANTIVAEADRLTRIVDDILALTRMENHMLELQPNPISTESLLRSLVRRLQPAMGPERLRVNLPPFLPWVRGDKEKLEQALLQTMLDIVRNARPETPVLLTAEANAGHVVIRIAYSALPERIERMTRALVGIGQSCEDGLSTRLGDGGLGLYIAKNLVKAHGGTMRLILVGEQSAVIAVTLLC